MSRANLIVGGAIVAVLAIACGLMALTGAADSPRDANGTTPEGLCALVHDADGRVYELPLDEDATLEVRTDAGSNTVVVEDGEVFVSQADCDNLDCMHQGRISAPNQQIICLPHKMWIEVTQTGEGAGHMDVDAVESAGSGTSAGSTGEGEGEDTEAEAAGEHALEPLDTTSR